MAAFFVYTNKMSYLPVNVVILAAGKGTRMHSDKPKVLHELAGKPLLSHVIQCAQELQATRIAVVYGFGGEQVRATINNENLYWIRQESQLGTGHAVQQAEHMLEENATVLILLGDVPLVQIASCRKLLEQAQHQLALFTVEKPQPKGYGRIVRGYDGRVDAIVEEKDATEEQREIREVNSGIMAMPVKHLKSWLQRLDNKNAQGEYYLTDIIAMAVEDGLKVVTQLAQDEWEVMGVNSKQDLAQLERYYQNQQAQTLLQKGVTLLDPHRIDIRGTLNTGRDVTIDVGCIFEGCVTLHDGVSVGAYSVLRDATIGSNTSIAPYTHIDAATVGSGNRLGPYARLRPGATLGEGVHIGNFVEIKNSEIDNDAKINHLSYVGDATVGKRVNIGAGTITCNYDGVNKHRTIIGDDAFIGSDSQLVAPVTVGQGATIGAGSTITKNAPETALTLGRAKQITINHWKRPEKKK